MIISRFVARFGRGIWNIVGTGLTSIWRVGSGRRNKKDFDLIRLVWINLKGILLTVWSAIQPRVRIFCQDLLKLATISFNNLHFFIEKKMIKKGLEFCFEFIKRLVKNDQLLHQISFYVTVFVLFWVVLFLWNKVVLFLWNKMVKYWLNHLYLFILLYLLTIFIILFSAR